MIRTTFSKLLLFVAACGFAAMPAITWGGHGGGGHGGGGHSGGGGGGHMGGGGGHMGGGHVGGGSFGGGGHMSGGHVGGGSFGGGHVGSSHMGGMHMGGAPSSGFRGNVGGGMTHGSMGGARIGAAPGTTFRGNMGSSSGVPSRGFNATHSVMPSRSGGTTAFGGASAGHTGSSFMSNHFAPSTGAAGGSFSGKAAHSVSPVSSNSFANRHSSGTSGISNHFASNHGATGGSFGAHSAHSISPVSSNSFATRHFSGTGGTGLSGHHHGSTNGVGGSNGTTIVNNNNYNNYGGYGYGGGYFNHGFGYGGYGGYGSRYFGYGGRGLLGSLLYGLGGYGYGGYGYGGYGGWGYGGYGSGYGNGYGYSNYGLGSYSYNPYATCSTPYVAAYSPTYTSVALTTGSVVSAPQTPTASGNIAPKTSGNFIESGETAFKAGDYKGAVYAWKHAAVDDAQNPVLLMMLGQALFATGNFDEAAGATQAAMQTLPKDQWGVVASNYKELYGSVQDYTNQLRALEKAVGDKPEHPGQRFLLGFHYGYLGFPQQSVDQLDKVLKLAPTDEVAKKLRDEMQTKLPKPAAPAVLPTPNVP